MTTIQYVETILDDEWHAEISNRPNDVPKPRIVREGDSEYRRMSLAESDYIVVSDGGVANYEPQSFGWVEERIVSRVTLDIRTSVSRERLWGHRDENNDAERYGGLVGECKRIMDSIRKGDKEFDLVPTESANDISAQMGGQQWRATMEVLLDDRVHNIDPST